MATSTSTAAGGNAKPAAAKSGGATIGVSLPKDLPAAAVRTALDRIGETALFWQQDPDEALAEALERKPDLMILGANRADPPALALVARILDGSERTRVVLICARTGAGEVRRVIDAGVRGLVALDEIETALGPVLDVVRAGQLSVPRAHGAELPKGILTAREKQILGLVVMGLTNGEIARRLFLAESTIKSHLSSSFAKLGVSSRSEATSVILDPRSGAGLGILTIPTG